MLHRHAFNSISKLTAILLIAAGLKWWYSTASADGLRIVLRPTAWLVEWVTGDRFRFESHTGYMNADHTFLIAAACSGINFWIAAFLMLSVLSVWRYRDRAGGWLSILTSVVIAYAATLLANTVRISLALTQRQSPTAGDYFDPGQMHRVEGILIYFGCLVLLYVLSVGASTAESVSPFSPKRLAIPLAIYWLTTLGIPIVNGSSKQGEQFWQHAGVVMAAPVVLIAGVTAIRYAAIAIGKRKRVSVPPSDGFSTGRAVSRPEPGG